VASDAERPRRRRREVEFTEFAPKIFAGAGENVFVQLDIAYRLKKNGATVKTSAVHHFVLDGGRVVSFREYEDTESVVKAWNA
jgi:ketosteroid isomerase-like protein